MPNVLGEIVFDVLAAEQHKQIRLRLDPTTLQRANELQEFFRAAGKHATLESIVGAAIEELHQSLIADR